MTAPHTSRRALLKGAAMLPVAPVAASAGGLSLFDAVGELEPVAPETPIMRLFRQWEAALQEQEAAYAAAQGEGYDWEDKVYEAHAPTRHRVEAAIAAEPPTDLRDLAIKVLVNSGEGAFGLSNALTLEVATLAGRNPDKIPRGLFEEDEAQAA